MPPVDVGRHLIDDLFEVGPSVAGEPLTFQEIAAWSGLTGRSLDAWEPVALRRLSLAYLAEYQAAETMSRPAPHLDAIAAVRPAPTPDEVSDRIMAAFERLERQDAEMSGKPPPPRMPRPPRPGRSRP
jgi:hypothetical protein